MLGLGRRRFLRRRLLLGRLRPGACSLPREPHPILGHLRQLPLELLFSRRPLLQSGLSRGLFHGLSRGLFRGPFRGRSRGLSLSPSRGLCRSLGLCLCRGRSLCCGLGLSCGLSLHRGICGALRTRLERLRFRRRLVGGGLHCRPHRSVGHHSLRHDGLRSLFIGGPVGHVAQSAEPSIAAGNGPERPDKAYFHTSVGLALHAWAEERGAAEGRWQLPQWLSHRLERSQRALDLVQPLLQGIQLLEQPDLAARGRRGRRW